VSGDVKGRLQAIAAQRQITESALVRHLIEAMVQMTTDAKIAGAAATFGMPGSTSGWRREIEFS
jgi:predicted transcriptional regulator